MWRTVALIFNLLWLPFRLLLPARGRGAGAPASALEIMLNLSGASIAGPPPRLDIRAEYHPAWVRRNFFFFSGRVFPDHPPAKVTSKSYVMDRGRATVNLPGRYPGAWRFRLSLVTLHLYAGGQWYEIHAARAKHVLKGQYQVITPEGSKTAGPIAAWHQTGSGAYDIDLSSSPSSELLLPPRRTITLEARL